MCKHGSCCLPIQKTFMIVNYALACVSLLPFLSSYSNKPYHISRIITNGKEQLTIHFNSETLEKFSKMNSKQERLGGVPTEQAQRYPPKATRWAGWACPKRAACSGAARAGTGTRGRPWWKGASICVFCLEMPAQLGFERCNHKCLCIRCAGNLEHHGYPSMCPVCRVISRAKLMW